MAALIPRTAFLDITDPGRDRDDGKKTVRLPSDLVTSGEHIIVCEGECIPVDGVAYSNHALISESWLTGAVLPRAVKMGDPVYAGSMIEQGDLVIRTQVCGLSTRIGQMLQTMMTTEVEPSTSRARDNIVDIFIDGIILLVVAALVVNLFYLDATWADSLARATNMFLCACPCTFSLSAPACLLAATGLASKAGVQLATGIQGIENTACTQMVLFDKTGTLTEARLRARVITSSTEWDMAIMSQASAWWAVVGAIERHSPHPVAVSITKESDRQLAMIRSQQLDCGNYVCPEAMTSGVKYSPGLGLQGWARLPNREPMHVAIGSRKFITSLGIDVDYTAVPEDARKSIATTVVVAIQSIQAGIIVCEDAIRPSSRAAVQALKRRGINVGIVTGDSFASASLVARSVGIHVENIFSDRLPMEKAEVVTSMRRRGPVTFVGDNLNDVPAFASSSFSIHVVSDRLLGSSPISLSVDAYLFPLAGRFAGTHAGFGHVEASESGGNASQDRVDLTRLIYLISLSSATVRRAKYNFLWTVVYNIVALLMSSGALYFLDPSLSMSP